MKRTIRGTAVAALAALTVAGIGETAIAGSDKVDSKVTIKKNDGFAFKGNVTSDKGACEKSRLVRVFRKQEGDDAQVGSDKTDSGGKFRVEVNVFQVNTRYYAVAVEKPAGDVTCQRSRSKNFVVEE